MREKKPIVRAAGPAEVEAEEPMITLEDLFVGRSRR